MKGARACVGLWACDQLLRSARGARGGATPTGFNLRPASGLRRPAGWRPPMGRSGGRPGLLTIARGFPRRGGGCFGSALNGTPAHARQQCLPVAGRRRAGVRPGRRRFGGGAVEPGGRERSEALLRRRPTRAAAACTPRRAHARSGYGGRSELGPARSRSAGPRARRRPHGGPAAALRGAKAVPGGRGAPPYGAPPRPRPRGTP